MDVKNVRVVVIEDYGPKRSTQEPDWPADMQIAGFQAARAANNRVVDEQVRPTIERGSRWRGQQVSRAVAGKKCVACFDSQAAPPRPEFPQVIIRINAVGLRTKVLLLGVFRSVDEAPVFVELIRSRRPHAVGLGGIGELNGRVIVEQQAVQGDPGPGAFVPYKVPQM